MKWLDTLFGFIGIILLIVITNVIVGALIVGPTFWFFLYGIALLYGAISTSDRPL